MKDDLLVTFYFNSGKQMDVTYSKERFDEMILCLRQGWNSCSTTGDKFGINFANVTHYEVFEIKEKQ